jgi:hypothetical protein
MCTRLSYCSIRVVSGSAFGYISASSPTSSHCSCSAKSVVLEFQARKSGFGKFFVCCGYRYQHSLLPIVRENVRSAEHQILYVVQIFWCSAPQLTYVFFVVGAFNCLGNYFRLLTVAFPRRTVHPYCSEVISPNFVGRHASFQLVVETSFTGFIVSVV